MSNLVPGSLFYTTGLNRKHTPTPTTISNDELDKRYARSVTFSRHLYVFCTKALNSKPCITGHISFIFGGSITNKKSTIVHRRELCGINK